MLLRRIRGRKHPVKYLFLITLLFADWQSFMAAYATTSKSKRLQDPKRAALVELMGECGMSVSEAARRLGLTLSKAVYWARKDGIPYRRRPRLVDEHLAAILSEALRTGVDVNDLASRLGLPVATVRRFLDTHAEVRASWRQARKG
jgi:transposase-like protein